jgi:hypothetical protein
MQRRFARLHRYKPSRVASKPHRHQPVTAPLLAGNASAEYFASTPRV